MTSQIKDKPISTTGNKSIISIIEGDIFEVQYNEGVIMEPADFKENLDLYKNRSNLECNKVLHNFLPYAIASAAARKYAGTIEIDVKAEAFVFTNLAQRLLVRFHILATKNKHPMRVFSNYGKALKWLKKF